jgi:hypothetical protein
MKPADNWGVNVEHLTPALYTQILRVIAGREPPAKGQEVTNDFLTLLPYFILAGLGGVRNCELIRYKRGEPVLQWADILWNKNLIFIRHGAARNWFCLRLPRPGYKAEGEICAARDVRAKAC